MSNEWAEMLKKFGIEAQIEELPVVEEMGNNSESTVTLLDMSDWMVVDVTGADAAAFLQGQFCNDLQQVSVTRAQITGYCTPKGRLLALPTIVGTQNGFRMLVNRSVKDAFIKRLSMFVMRSDVTLNERDDLVCSGILAAASGSLGELAQAIGALPASPLDVATSEDSQLIRWHDDSVQSNHARYILVSEKAAAIDLWTNNADVEKCSVARWRLGDISAGVPSVTPGVSEAFVPQMINLQLIEALSFTKGCYPGQEIVARMQYLGKLKRHMRLFKAPIVQGAVLPGSKVSSGEDAEAGIVVDAVAVAEPTDAAAGYTLLLAVVKVAADTNKFAFEGEALEAMNLPYELPSLSDKDPGESD